MAGKGIIYNNPSNDPALKSAYDKIRKSPTYKPPKGGTFNVDKMQKVKKHVPNKVNEA